MIIIVLCPTSIALRPTSAAGHRHDFTRTAITPYPGLPSGHCASTISPIAHLVTAPVPFIVSTARRFTIGLSFLLSARSTSCASRPPTMASVGGKNAVACSARWLQRRKPLRRRTSGPCHTHSIALLAIEGKAFSLTPRAVLSSSAIDSSSSRCPDLPEGKSSCRCSNSHSAVSG